MSKPPQPFPELLLLFLISIPFYVISETIETERTVLLNLKQQLGNPPAIQSWNDSSSPCSWPGINCTDGSVTSVSLHINITVKIPPSICKLKNLTFLDLASNFIPGEFPTLLYNCSKLQYLDLSHNNFIGSIPADIYKLSTLVYLDVNSNNFSGHIPPSIGGLRELKELRLQDNQFNGTFPKEIGNLSNLERLWMANNGFVPMKIPNGFTQLKKLKNLWITETNLIGTIPDGFADISSLEWLELSHNNLEGPIPSRLLMLKNLTNLYLFDNELSGEIPRTVEALNLVEIDLSRNNLTGTIPEEFGMMQKLVFFDLISNQLTGEIPAGMDKLPVLKIFKIFSNKLSGVLPAEFGLHSKLEVFEVCGNQFTGQLPENLCAGRVLRGVVAFSNNLSGPIPASLGDCSTLTTVQLHNNQFSGEIPPGLWTTFNLSVLILSNNSFSGELPSQLGRNLSTVKISKNKFSGNIPIGIGSWSSLRVFEASNNLFSGKIPEETTNLSGLITLHLDGNQLSGQLPSDIASWKSLNTLDLSGNKLSGQIPAAIGSLPDLLNLDLSENQFSGKIPDNLANLRLTSLNLSSNKLYGKIPDDSKPRKLTSKYLPLILSLAVIIVIVTVLSILFVMIDYRGKKREGDHATWKLTSFHRLDFTEENIVSRLTENNLIGSGGSGKVYKIAINESGGFVAVKRIWNNKKLDGKLEKEFTAEVEILGRIRHANIVKLLCCISNENSKHLVYEYMENQSLDRWLHAKEKKSSSLGMNSVHHVVLDWPTRMQIAIGAAQGLCYMHHDYCPPIIHRDVKSSNILLDSEFKARIADFGLAKMLNKQGEPHTMSAIAGSFGYLAPEYAYTRRVNEKIDVYSFGVVLLELVTGREANRGDEHTSLAEWAWQHYSEGRPEVEIFDPEAYEPCHLEEMTSVYKLGLICTSTSPSSRPSMKEVLHCLQHHGPLGRSYKGNKTEREVHDAPVPCSSTYGYKQSTKESGEDDYRAINCV
ncbi:hypothetical protein SLEP1_g15770 [Rubroshorea leprosula]|uniref:Protein kinase domain-containing protein n=1 Tax=Rubroshorea leprosula TaxID=152421 RepID=A0AAV5IXF4_9ROSI|nr:hypothetical protein SLEP1_g15770 [Rubroshorea leprosula]